MLGPPRKRYTGKTAPRIVSATPMICSTKIAGDRQVPNNWAGGSHPVTCSSPEEEDREMVLLRQHVALGRWISEVAGLTNQGVATVEEVEMVGSAREELMVLEALLEEISMKKVQETNASSVLQTQMVAMDEVRRNIEEWKQPFEEEVKALTSSALEPIDGEQFNQLLAGPMEVECLPMKGVASVKPPCRRKARIVVCGNYAAEKEDEGLDNSASGVDSVCIRTFINAAVHYGWTAGSIDVSKAFLQAPRRTAEKRITIGIPPKIVTDMKLVPQGQRWIIHQALYGLAESPGDWGAHRDGELSVIKWSDDGDIYKLIKTPERNVWRIVREKDEGAAEPLGFVLIYVDDMLILGREQLVRSTAQAVGRRWQCSEPEFLQEHTSMRFCGFELMREGSGIRLDQFGYTHEMLKKYDITQEESCPLPKVPDDEETVEESYSVEDLRRAQSIVGELLWLSTRTRPDLAFGVGLLGRLVHKRPQLVAKLGLHMLKYVKKTSSWGLIYEKCREADLGEDGELQQLRTVGRVQAYADISFAPAREAYRSIQGIGIQHGRNLLAWESGRQPFVCASTAESELISYCEAHQVTEAVTGLIEIAGFEVDRQLYGDNKAALAAVTNETGSWRTRHLRLRAYALREALAQPGRKWVARHLVGTLLLADGLTKPLLGRSFDNHRRKLGMKPREVEATPAEQGGTQGCGSAKAMALLLGSIGLWKSGHPKLAAILGAVAGIGMLTGWNQQEKYDESKALASEKAEHEGALRMMRADLEGLCRGECHNGRALQCICSSGQGLCDCECLDSRAVQSSLRPEQGLCLGVCGDSRALQGMGIGVPGLRAVRLKKDKKEKKSAGSEDDGVKSDVVKVTDEMTKLNITTTVTMEFGGHRQGHRAAKKESDGRVTTGASGSGSRDHEEDLVLAPWKGARFDRAPKGADKWDLSLVDYGWLIRSHGTKGRVRPFHPIHKSCPVRGDDLTGERTTKVFNIDSPDGDVLHDRWMEQRTWQKAGPWSGYTFLRLKDKGNEKTDGGSSGGYAKPTTKRVESTKSSSEDDGYSFVSEGETDW